ncbi:MAG TPA: hypothetical protein VMU75_06910 [Acidimicrobiales bacterium]|nr:hypothetical protein [Acidimicrobiales bacterium]
MAELVMGLGTSHTPQLSTPVSTWSDHAARDRANSRLLGVDGEYHSYDDLLAAADPAVAAELGTAAWEGKYQRCQAAIAELGRRLEVARPDVVVVIGDDQEELFGDDGTSTFSLFLGEQLADLAPSAAVRARMPLGLQEALWAAHAPDGDVYRSQPALSLHLVEHLTARDFDVNRFSRQHEGRSLGHAFTFVRRRLGLAGHVPMVPVFVNTYYPPNVPSAARCYAFGEALAEAIAAWPEPCRVVVVASGGLSHFVINEELDRRVLGALARHDGADLAAIERKHLRSGTSEILNWLAAGGALRGRDMEVIDYVAGYRSPAGTGTAMCFSVWS